MSEPLIIRRVVGRSAWTNLQWVVATIVIGALVAGSSLVAATTEDLDRNQQIQATFLSAIGAVVLWWGASRITAARRQVHRGPVLRLSEAEVWMRIGSLEGSAEARIPWTAVESVGIAPVPHTMGMPDPGPRVVLRFVLADDSKVVHDPLGPADVVKAAVLGLPPLAGATSMIFGSETGRRLPEIVAWLREHQPDLPVTSTDEPG